MTSRNVQLAGFYGIQTARVAIAVFAATSAGVFMSSLVPVLLFQLPLVVVLFPSRVFLAFLLMFAVLVAVPFFLLASSQRRLGLGAYVGYGTGMACGVMTFLSFSNASPDNLSQTRLYDVAWIVLTQAIPGGMAAGAVAYSAMTVGRQYQKRPA